ncbi:hypothetical protein F7R21_29455 [Burkholderia latens]|uniref:Uncharacterized protein n=1 Tax=Burkholderia latens TaxID=488446 RepID=A0A6H9TD67_9BURK|nr:hypothetical protein F7R21_29455 [Burkholderia latens]
MRCNSSIEIIGARDSSVMTRSGVVLDASAMSGRPMRPDAASNQLPPLHGNALPRPSDTAVLAL